MTGATRALAHAAAEGALAEPAVRTVLIRCDLAGAAELRAADAMLFACPEMLGSMAGTMKDFFDRTYYPVLEDLYGRPYAAMIAAGSDGAGAARQVASIATGWRLRQVAPPLICCTHAQTAAAILAEKHPDVSELARARELGAALATGLAIGVW